MTCLFGWIPRHPGADAREVVAAMRRTLQVNSACTGSEWPVMAGAVGAMDLVTPAPAFVSADGRFHVWAAGEVVSGLPGAALPVDAQSGPVRAALLCELQHRGAQALAAVNGEFQVAVWDAVDRSLLLACDRFGCLPLYWTTTHEGLAFAGTVGAVLQAPTVSREADDQTIREAVAFGGFRLGDRTNLRDVSMLRGGRVLVYRNGSADVRRYWSFPSPPDPTTRRVDDLMDEAGALWQTAIARRLRGAQRPGTTLSGGLDSRAVMAEACSQGASLTALTYGLPGCDDRRLARRAATQADVPWAFVPLYEGEWLERRTQFIPYTDGLVQLVDLMHFETFDRQMSMMDVNLSGYIGDVVCGDTYADVVDVDSLLSRLPYSGVPVAWPLERAREWAEGALATVAPAAGRFVIFEHKFPQAIHRIFQAGQRHIRVRRPFIDHDLFDFYAGLDAPTRVRVYHGMLRSRYPALFARIPHQKTNAPVLTSPLNVQVRRIARFAGRRVRDVVARTGFVQQAPSRSYHNEERYWGVPAVRARITATILRPGSVSAEIFGRRVLTKFVDEWFTRFNGPAQPVGALYVFEHYHHALGSARHEPIASAAS